MRKEILNVFVLVSIGCLYLLSSCSDNPLNPCLDKKLVEAKFTMGELIPGEGNDPDSVIVSDTVLTDNTIIFKASEDYDSYSWKIGDDPKVFISKEVKIYFQYPENRVPVRLIIKKSPYKSCFPNDDGIDTLVKYLTVISRKQNPIFGEYRGGNQSNVSDIFNIQVTHDSFFDQINILNINKDCYPIDETIGLRGFLTRMAYKKMYFYSGFFYKSCSDPKGWLALDKSGKNIQVVYSTALNPNNDANRVNEIYKGVKIK
jgi:hypothetical protein